MNDRQKTSPRQRLQELLAIPEQKRTDAQWDEINELEIALSAANRAETRDPSMRRPSAASDDQPKNSGATPGKKPFKKFHKRTPKANPPS